MTPLIPKQQLNEFMKLLPILLATALQAAILPAVGHDHFAVGIIDANNNGKADAGEQLQLTGTNWSNRTFFLLPRPLGQRCGGYYNLSEAVRTLSPESFSLIALSDGQYDLASTNHAHTGAWIWAEIVSVAGPAGAHFGFWEEGSTVVTHSLATNQLTGNPRFVISEGIDDVNDDPFGHIHGRAWTANKPGEYLVGIRFIDLSTTRPSGGSWHTPSQTYIFKFQAGPNFQPSMTRNTNGSITLTWPSQMGIWNGFQTGIPFTIQRSTTMAATNWQNLGTVTGTIANIATFTDTSPPAGKAFYRLTYSWFTP